MVTPIKNNVIVKPFPPDRTTEGGLIVPESAQKVSNKVKVVAVGGGTKTRPMTLKEGQTAFRVKDWGQEILINNDLHFIMDSSAVLAVESNGEKTKNTVKENRPQKRCTYEIKSENGKIKVNIA